jgi:hypothetical protein
MIHMLYTSVPFIYHRNEVITVSLLETAGRILLGLSIAGFGVSLLAYWIYMIPKGPYGRTAKLISTIVILPSLLLIDSGSGYVVSGNNVVKPVTVEREPDAPDRLFMLFHGYNGSGESQVEILGSQLTSRGSVIAFQSGPGSYDSERILTLARKIINERRPDELILYGESFGGMMVMDLLRRDPTLHPRSIVFNATPSSASNIKIGWAVLNAPNVRLLFHGGPLSTELLRLNQDWDLQTVPPPEPGSNEQTRQRAYEAMRRITGPVFSDQLRYMANFQPPRPGEFAGRAKVVHYLRAPSISDTTIKTAASAAVLRSAFSDVTFQEISVADWAPNLHAPTPERPRPLINALLAASR